MANRKKSFLDQLIRKFKKQKSKGTHRPRSYIKKEHAVRFYSVEEKLRILKEFEASGAPPSIFAKWIGVAAGTLERWQNDLKTKGEAGLINKIKHLEDKLPPEIIQKIINLKKDNPEMGSNKIVEWLARHDFVKTSRESVLKLLKKNPETRELIAEPVVPKNPRKYEPQRFERSKPRQMYQMDITPWKLKGLFTVYIIAALDDYSRFVVSWGVFRRQTSEHCIDVLRNAIEQYSSTPEEMLTDNGRQFYTWRGKNDFQKFLLKMGIKHIRSRPYHPQTLGKVESLWRNIYRELLSRETIVNFEDLREKLRQWIDRYNFKRPHQGIGGLVPADRFFGVEKQMREAMLEGAGMVKDALVIDPYRLTRPMYLIGRIGNKEIRVMAKDGSVIVKGIDSIEKKTLPPEKNKVESEQKDKDSNQGEGDGKQISSSDPVGGKDSSGPVGLEQAQDGPGDMSGVGNQQTNLLPVGEEDHRRDEAIVSPAKERPQEKALGESREAGEEDTRIESTGQGAQEEGTDASAGERINQE